MKIYLYLKHFPPHGDELNEGTSKAVHGLATGLAACGADVTILCEGAKKDEIYQTKMGYQIASFASKSTKPSFQVSSSLQRYILSNSRPSIFIITGIFHRSVYSLSRFLKQQSLPYIVAPHDPYHPTIFYKNAHLKWIYWYLLERPMLNQACAVQVLDKRHAEWLHRLKIKTPIIEVPNGFSPTDVYPESTLSWHEDGVPKFLFLGRLDAYNKGLDILLNAFAQLREVPEWQLTIQGPDWGDRTTLKQQAKKLGLSQNIIFREPEYNLSPSAIIAPYDVFCIASRFEGFSLSAMEAMLAGRVLIVSDIAGIAPYVQASDCGVVVKPEPEAIKSGILSLIARRSEWKEMGLRGRKYILENLHWQKIAARAIEEYVYFQ
ncbi:glycosyltransferase [Anabaena azotica]|uniref:Glycosyltransferase n=1 Tax=Anabaena azotica FACHB-119 TaxID=947527 RepID=A0ABR8D6H1_9NOST|nr:glycosyltransferase [Anabaena azotica]MBD2501920.1 glycosyltransferase [Anabaena azotica FACHB-119]